MTAAPIAPSPAPWTPGQAAYREFMLASPPRVPDVEAAIAFTWQAMSAKGRARWEAVAKAAARATPVHRRLLLALCGDHPGEVHAQVLDAPAAGLTAWVCLRALADVAESDSAGLSELPVSGPWSTAIER